MSEHVGGNIRGLAPSELRKVERLAHRKLDAEEIVSLEFARELFGVADELRRRVGVLVSREGRIEELFLGSKDILYLPDLGRYRLGRGRLRRLRLIFSDLSERHPEAAIPHDVYTDLEKLRLDAVVAVRGVKNRMSVAYAHLVPLQEQGQSPIRTEKVPDLGRLSLNFTDFIAGLEEELSTSTDRLRSTGLPGAVLVGVYEKGARDVESSLNELHELARSAGVKVLGTIVQRRELDPRTLLGKGKLEEVILQALRLEAEVIIFDTELRPSQWRAITNATELKVLDRSMLILDIFAQRAKSSDGRLQVELAQLKYNLPRLVEMDAGLSRLSGGIGGRGPGETKLELGRRRARDRIAELERRIRQLGEQRTLRKKRRKDADIPLVAILGYTNVGKSTLFNALTKSSVVAEDKLFATLDPAQRRINLNDPANPARVAPVILSDTVGFIRQLPEELRSAFRATLEELYDAALLVHVLDASDPEVERRKNAVESILEEMKLGAVPTILVLNKIDQAPEDLWLPLQRSWGAIPVSAIERRGFDLLLSRITTSLRRQPSQREIEGEVVEWGGS